MLTWLSLGLLASVAAVVVRWLTTRVDAIGRQRGFPWTSVVLLVALAGATATPGVLDGLRERRLVQVASAVVGAKVGVHCQTFGEAFVDTGIELGYVRFGADGIPERSTLIKRDQCRDLADYQRSDKHDPSRAQVVAVHVLTHEAMHMAGIVDEARAECAAVQRDAHTARLLGASAADARVLAGRYWRTVYPLMPDGYRTPECGPGRSLDEAGPDAPWSAPAR
ncbi:MAG TPA: hypothetical protein VF486_14650 [Actinomycetes bacterium]